MTEEICIRQHTCQFLKECSDGLCIVGEQLDVVSNNMKAGKISFPSKDADPNMLVSVPKICPRKMNKAICAVMFVSTRKYAETHGGIRQ